MNRTRVYQIAKYLKCTSKDLAKFIADLGLDINCHSSSLSESEVEIVMHEYLLKYPDALKDKFDLKYIENDKGSPFINTIIDVLKKRAEYQNEHHEQFKLSEDFEKIREVKIESWMDFAEKVNGLEYRRWIFRGQSNSEWKLETSIFRAFREVSNLRSQNKKILPYIARNNYEMLMVEYFKSNAHMYLSNLPGDEDNLEWLAIMQHYGAPTRMLDFSFSPYIALYFSISTGINDSAIYCFDKYTIMKWGSRNVMEQKIFHNMTRDDAYLLTYEPKKTNSRLCNQQGLFLIPSNNYESIDNIINNVGFSNEEVGFKYIIPKELHYEMIECLKKMNVSSSLLFPGIEGYTLSLKNLMLENNETLLKLNNRNQSSRVPLE